MRLASFALTIVFLAAGAAEAKRKEGKVRVELPANARFKEALLSSVVFDNHEVLLAAGGPTTGYDVYLKLWPAGPTVLIEGKLGKDELLADPRFTSMWTPKLSIQAAPDGHAIAVSSDNGVSWHGAWMDGPVAFVCHHELISPKAIPDTRAIVLEVLRDPAKHHDWPRYESVRSISGGRGGADELEAAFFYATLFPEDDELVDAVIDALTKVQTVGRLSFGDETLTQAMGRAAKVRAEAGGRTAALAAGRDEISAYSFWKGFDEGPIDAGTQERAPVPTPAPPSIRPCRLGAPRSGTAPVPLTPGLALAYLGFPGKMDARSCAAWRQLDARIDATLRELKLPAPSQPQPPMPQALSQLMMCGQMAMAMLMGFGPFGGPGAAIASAGHPALASYEHEALRCGHVDAPDPRCVVRVKKATEAKWNALIETERQRSCSALEGIAIQVRGCLEAADKAPITDPYHHALALQSEWNLVNIASKSLGGVNCPPAKGIEFPPLIE